MTEKRFRCPVCGSGRGTTTKPVFWPELIEEWGLAPAEATHLDSRDSLECRTCRANLRSMTMAVAIRRILDFRLPLVFVGLRHPWTRVLQLNAPGKLRRYLRGFPRQTYGDYPQVDMQRLPYCDASFDLVLHGDTLEHVPDPLRALSECLRVLRPGGHLCYTIPIVVDRPTRTRADLPPSYHGSVGNLDYLVHTEYGDDFWHQPFEAGFSDVRIVGLRYPASFAVVCRR